MAFSSRAQAAGSPDVREKEGWPEGAWGTAGQEQQQDRAAGREGLAKGVLRWLLKLRLDGEGMKKGVVFYCNDRKWQGKETVGFEEVEHPAYWEVGVGRLGVGGSDRSGLENRARQYVTKG